MTDNEIIKALECCGDEGEIAMCSICPYYLQDRDNDFCQEDLHRASLDLINRHKERFKEMCIKRTKQGERNTKFILHLQTIIAEQKEEIDRLKEFEHMYNELCK